MAHSDIIDSRRGNRWRLAGWGIAAFVLTLPFLAMQFTSEVDWDERDFIAFGAMLAIAGGTLELAAKQQGNALYRAGSAVAVLAGFLLVWVNVAVGFFGDEGNPANLMFLGVLGVAVVGSIAARTPGAKARAMVATLAAQLLVGVIVLVWGLGEAGWRGVFEAVMGTGLFAGMWLVAAGLFYWSGREG